MDPAAALSAPMPLQLALATAMVLATVMIHGAGLAVLGRALRIERLQEVGRHVPPLSARSLVFTLLVVLALFTLHGIEIWLYAALYLALHAVQDLEVAVYFSTLTYGAIGYGDQYMAPAWRLVAAIEGINGVLLIGWSTAFFVSVVARLDLRRR